MTLLKCYHRTDTVNQNANTAEAKRSLVDTPLLLSPFLITYVIQWQRRCANRGFIYLSAVCVPLPLCRKSSHSNAAPSVFLFPCSQSIKEIWGKAPAKERRRRCIPNHSNTPLPGFIRLRQAEYRLAILCQRRTRKATEHAVREKKEGGDNNVKWHLMRAFASRCAYSCAARRSRRESDI